MKLPADQPDYPSILSASRNLGDEVADQFISDVFASPQKKQNLQLLLARLTYNHQLAEFQREYADEPLLSAFQQLPPWADGKLMQQGAAFFARYAPLIMNMLGLLSLPYCYAAADGARVLYLSERMRTDTGKRLQETGDFVWDVLAPNAFEPDGKGFASLLKVRLMHAAVRYYTLQGGKWQSAWGFPINQEDMAGTNLSFSLIVIRGLRKLDVAITYEEQQAFMHVWNVIGHLSGIRPELLPQTGKQAFDLEQHIRQRQFAASEQGRALTDALVSYFRSVSGTGPFSGAGTVQLMRYLMGDDVADLLGLPAGELPAGLLNLLKLSGTWQAMRYMPQVWRAYQAQYTEYKRQQQQLNT